MAVSENHDDTQSIERILDEVTPPVQNQGESLPPEAIRLLHELAEKLDCAVPLLEPDKDPDTPNNQNSNVR